VNHIDVVAQRLLDAWPDGGIVGGDKVFNGAAKRNPPWLAERALGRNVVRDILEIGARLREVRNLLYHGEWERWLDCEFGWSSRTARRCMAAAKAFADKTDIVSELPIDIGALYLLARPRMPEEARAQAVERAKLGERITRAVAADIVKTFGRPPAGPRLGDLRPMVEESVKRHFDHVGGAFSWNHDKPAVIATIMVRTPERAIKMAKALIRALAAIGSSEAPELQRRLEAVVGAKAAESASAE
jgi:hypothetical protein